jgi:hypothetical protein
MSPSPDGFSRPDLAIPHQVAPQQSLSLFGQALDRSTCAGGGADEIENRPNAPTGSEGAAKRIRRLQTPQNQQFRRPNRHPFTVGFDAPPDGRFSRAY